MCNGQQKSDDVGATIIVHIDDWIFANRWLEENVDKDTWYHFELFNAIQVFFKYSQDADAFKLVWG